MKTKEEVLFEDAPVFRAVLSLVVPTVVSQLITVVYNMADTLSSLRPKRSGQMNLRKRPRIWIPKAPKGPLRALVWRMVSSSILAQKNLRT